MGHQDDLPAESTNGCLHELARILAAGILRSRGLTALFAEEKLSESGQDCLEVSDQTVLTVHSGKRSPRLSEGDDYVD